MVRKLSNELQKKAEKELNEISHKNGADVEVIKDWLNLQPHIQARTDDQWLLAFLRGCKFSLEATKEKLDVFYTMRSMVPEFFTKRDPFLPEIQEVLKLGLVLPLTKNGCPAAPRIILTRCEPWNPSKIELVTILKVSMMIADILVKEDDNFVIAGQHIFVDSKGMNLNHVLQISPGICKKSIVCLQTAYPTRPKGFHFINTPSIFETVLFNVIKPLADEKIRNRLFLYNENDMKKLYKLIPNSVLPKEYGGDGQSLNELTGYWKKKVESYRDWFLEDSKYGSNEKLRPGRSKFSDQLFGVDGSFRKLTVD